jgi:lipopolysaccharide export system permease protein
MVKLDRYIGTSVFLAILAVLGVIVSLSMLFAYIDELGDLSESYGLLEAGVWVLLTVPGRIYEMLPMAALIGCLIGLGTLASYSELTIMRAAGVSVGRIVWAVMKPMLVLMLLGILIGEYIAPWSENLAQANRAMAQGGGEAQSSKRGLWHRQGDEFVHINAVQPNGMLLGVTRYQFDQQRNLLSASFARRALYQGDHWQLEDVTTTLLHERSSEVLQAPSERWGVELNPQLLGTVV